MAYTKPVVTTHLPTKVFILITGVILSISMTHDQPLVFGYGMRFSLVAQSGFTQPVLHLQPLVRARSTPKLPRLYPNRTHLAAYGRSLVASLASYPVGMARCVGSAHGVPSWREGVSRTW